MKTSRPSLARRRTGSVLVLTAIMMVVLMSFLALSVDLGYLHVAAVQLQQSADAAALAGAAQLWDDEALTGHADLSDEVDSARSRAIQFAALNQVCQTAPVVSGNYSNDSGGNIVVGNLWDPTDQAQSMTFTDPNLYNAVQVRVRRSPDENGQVPTFFARVMNYNGATMQASATAALITNFSGFSAPSDGSNLQMLPFALDKVTWDGLMAGVGTDSWRWNSSTSQVTSGSDSIKEVNLYPQGTGSPGNRGTVDIGSSNNSTNDIARQIVHGISPADLAYFPNSELKFNSQGKLNLNGDTGISAGVKDELASIIGQPRIIPIFESVSGPGNNAQYVIVKFAGVRIVDVSLTGSPSNKRVIIQPAPIKITGGIPSSTQTSYFMRSKIWLVR